MTTAKKHFDEDIARALALLENARILSIAAPGDQLHNDVRGAAVALTVGAMDAYLCDKYADCLTNALKAYLNRTWPGKFPASFYKQLLPAGEVLSAQRTHRPLWNIRMAARAYAESAYMYSIGKLDDLFNGILPPANKLWVGLVAPLAALNMVRFTRHHTTALAAMRAKPLQKAQKELLASVKSRIGATVQFRHDWIHNCARPKQAIVNYTHLEARAAISEIKYFIDIFETYIEAFRIK